MSAQSLVLFVSVLAIAVAANRAEDSSTTIKRGPTSVASVKEQGFLQKEVLKRTHKLRGPLAVAVELIGSGPVQSGDVFVLKGILSAEVALNNVEFTWNLPAGVEVVNGEVSSVISLLSDAKPFETQITLRQVSPENVRVMLKARGRDHGSRFSDSVQYHTMDQKLIEASRQKLRKSTEAYVQEEKRLKVFH